LRQNVESGYYFKKLKHSFQAEGFGIRVRPVRMEDAAFIVWLRNLEHTRGKIGDSAQDVAAQEAWLRDYFLREGDYYFIAETLGGISFGTHAVYNIKGITGEKGRHVMRQEVLAGVPAGMLVTDLAFGTLGLTELTSACVSTNRPVRSIHLKTGFKQVGIKRDAQIIDGQSVDLLEFLIKKEDWRVAREGLLPLARMAEAQVQAWEKTELGRPQPWHKSAVV
jgi:RimJ/RimL family protein N-acetyltransferase